MAVTAETSATIISTDAIQSRRSRLRMGRIIICHPGPELEMNSKGESCLKTLLVGFVIGIIAVPMVVFLYFTSGRAPPASGDNPLPFEKMLAHSALHAHIDREMPKSVPIQANEGTFLAGAHIYAEHCGICHGFPNMDQRPIAKGMFPKPPALFRGK